MVFADLFFIYVFLPLCLICYGLAKKLSTKNIVLIVFNSSFTLGASRFGFCFCCSVHSLTGSSAY